MAQIIFTNSARSAIKRDNLSENNVYDAIHYADRTFPGRQPGTTVYSKKTGYGIVSAVVKKGQNGEDVILTCWLKRFSGNNYRAPEDKKYKKASFWEKILRDLLSIVGIK
jgi:hypothetical protein